MKTLRPLLLAVLPVASLAGCKKDEEIKGELSGLWYLREVLTREIPSSG